MQGVDRLTRVPDHGAVILGVGVVAGGAADLASVRAEHRADHLEIQLEIQFYPQQIFYCSFLVQRNGPNCTKMQPREISVAKS